MRALLLGLGLICLASCRATEVKGPKFLDAEARPLKVFQTGRLEEGREGRFGPSSPGNGFIIAGRGGSAAGPREGIELKPGEALELEFSLLLPKTEGPRLNLSLSAKRDGSSPFRTLSFKASPSHLYYVVPLPGSGRLSFIGLSLEGENRGGEGGQAEVELISARIRPSWAGFERLADGVRISAQTSVYMKAGRERVVLAELPSLPPTPPEEEKPGLLLAYGSGGGDGRMSLRADDGPSLDIKPRPSALRTFLPEALYPRARASLELSLPEGVECSALVYGLISEPDSELADFGRILRSPAADASRDYDLYRWDIINSVLILDFKDYATQDAYLKRLAFFVEKQGFKGRLAPDTEIAPLHGWNAHDYRAEDLAAFFELARKKAFPLRGEELELKRLLLERGLIVERGGRYETGAGAFISISRESEAYLRSLFLTHESTHAILFLDPDYRSFVIKAWAAKTEEERWFWKLYFDWMHYETKDDYLMANEWQAYLLQQTLAQVSDYFTKLLPARLLEKHPDLEPRIEAYMAEYGTSFEASARSLDAWLGAKYGFRAGRGSAY